MTDFLTWAILVITLLVFFIYFLERRRLQKLPPGPLGLPILGVLPRFDFRDIETYRRLRRQYGDIYSLNLGLQKVVVVCGYEMLREVFVVNGDATSDRPQNYLMKELSENAGMYMYRDMSLNYGSFLNCRFYLDCIFVFQVHAKFIIWDQNLF